MNKVRLEDVSERGSSNLAQKDIEGIDGNYPIYGASGYIGNVDFYHQEDEYIAVVKDGAGVGRTMFLPAKSSVIGTLQYIIPKGSIFPKYLYYAVKKLNLARYNTGTTIPHIYYKDYKKETFCLPDEFEQRKVVVILETVEKVIEEQQQELLELDNLIKSRFVEMFGTLQDNRNRYDIVAIEEVCSMIKDGTHQTPTYTEDTENGYKFLSSKDVMTQKIDWTDVKYIPSELHEKLYATIHPRRNDILMSKNGVNYGVAAINDTDEVFDIYVSLALLRPTEVIDPVYFRCVINNPDTKRQFDGSIKGIGVPNLHLGEIKKTKILLPPLKLQNQFADFVTQTTKLKLEIQKSLDETQTLMDALMQEYFG